MAADGGFSTNLAECTSWQKPAVQSKFRWYFIEIGTGRSFWKAALRITWIFLHKWPEHPVPMALSAGPYTYGTSVDPPIIRTGSRDFVASYIDPLIAFVSANAWLAYLTLFLAALLEAVPVIGSVIPGSTIILALSALVPGGELALQWVLAAAIAGALLGDGSAFWLGHRARREILGTWPLNRYPRVLAQSEAFFHRFGTWAVFFARFVPPIRALVPMSEVLRYSPDLRSMTSGRGDFELEFSHYEETPPHIAEKIIKQAQAAKAERHA